jgi:hypothetical protein
MVGDLAGKLPKLLGKINFAKIGKQVFGVVESVVTTVVGFIGRINFGAILAKIKSAFAAVKDVVGQVLDALKPAQPFLENVLIPLFKGVAIGVIGGVVGAFKVLVPVIKIVMTVLGALGKVLAPYKGIIEKIGMVVGVVFGGAILKVISLLGKLGGVFRVVGGAAKVLGIPLRILTGAVRGVFRVVSVLIGGFVDAITLMGRVGSTFTGMGRKIIVGATNFVGGVIAKIEGLITKIRGFGTKFFNAGKSIAQAIGKGLLSAFTAAAGFAAQIGRAVADWLNDHTPFGDKINLGITSFRIPALATGGVIQRGGIALVGERGPELVRLRGGSTVYDAQQTRAAMASAGGDRQTRRAAMAPIVVHVHPTIAVTTKLDRQVLHEEMFKVERVKVEAQ